MNDPLHPTGKCRCAGEGTCEWCTTPTACGCTNATCGGCGDGDDPDGAIPEAWLAGDGWLANDDEQYIVFPLDEHCTALGRDAYDLRWHFHRLTPAQLNEIGLSEATPWVARWGAFRNTDEGDAYHCEVLRAGTTPEDLAEKLNSYMQSIVDEWIAGEPERAERLRARARDWLRVNGYDTQPDSDEVKAAQLEVALTFAAPAVALTFAAPAVAVLDRAEDAFARLRYPLYCVDRGEMFNDAQFVGPFATHDEAQGRADADDLIARCRRLRPSEIRVDFDRDLADCRTPSDVADVFDQAVTVNGEIPDAAWYAWSGRVVHLEIDGDTLPTASDFREWADEHLRADVYICED